ncbi:response regulator [Pontibacter sp. BT310]|jgi:CRP/FNR family transcriptional regulator, polysaccharide utilization system transcription regulator|uniref:Response regulator n=1 Tax=Pontibacter populi TaxID=890055 RepID=A0ABS6XDG1_9BACT|nr:MULTISPECIES: response regulator [Pontibacter]MBJ6119169.1 response regulator [Pontibacter sp. BT310]MBR0571597.1 response regulator [Microvirga sp. STS03]MBW3366023.1 response regulator [Pontibacter populi]
MKKILLIEDNQEIRENTAEILSLANYSVLEAENGKAGVELAKSERPDLIICDIMMPQLDGYGVLHMLSKNPATSSIPFIFLTAKSEKEDFRKGMNLGADDYLTKPFDDLELLDAVEMRLKKNEILKAEFNKSVEGIDSFIQEARGFEDLNKLLSDKRKVTVFKKKQHLFMEGYRTTALYFLNKGKIKTFKANEEGREYITNLYKDGDFIGYLDLLEETPYRESAVALEDSEVYIIPKEDFFTLLNHNRDIANKFIKLLSDNLADREERLLKLAYNSVRKRVAEALLLVEKQYQQQAGDKTQISITREDLASIVGASKETVIRTLADFKDEKLIDSQGSRIFILDSAKLAKMRN